MGLKGFERRLERLVEGAFARAFKSSPRPVELGRRLVREMDDQRTVGVRGQTAVPNHFTITLAPDDYDDLSGVEGSLSRELTEAARTHAREEGYVFMGPAEVRPNADGYYVVDLGSTNGTRVNGAGITERQLRDGDTISVGDSQLRFEAS